MDNFLVMGCPIFHFLARLAFLPTHLFSNCDLCLMSYFCTLVWMFLSSKIPSQRDFHRPFLSRIYDDTVIANLYYVLIIIYG